jgi:UDP-N-acetylmuramoylalanine--D-glutamate ligase
MKIIQYIGDMFKNSRLTGRLSGNIGYVASKVAQEVSSKEYLITELLVPVTAIIGASEIR